MDSSLIFVDDAERAACVAHAHLEVRNWEPGLVLNDRYTKQDYQRRRHGHLGRHPETRHLPGLARRAARDGDLLFSRKPELSVQAIRRFELHHSLEPLTPLPTTWNMQTGDENFALYAPIEWQPNLPPFEQTAASLPTEQDMNDKFIPSHPQRAAWNQSSLSVLNPPQDPETLNSVINDLSYPLGTIHSPPPQYRTHQEDSSLSAEQEAEPTPVPSHLQNDAWQPWWTVVRNAPQDQETLERMINDLKYPLGSVPTPPSQYDHQHGGMRAANNATEPVLVETSTDPSLLHWKSSPS